MRLRQSVVVEHLSLTHGSKRAHRILMRHKATSQFNTPVRAPEQVSQTSPKECLITDKLTVSIHRVSQVSAGNTSLTLVERSPSRSTSRIKRPDAPSGLRFNSSRRHWLRSLVGLSQSGMTKKSSRAISGLPSRSQQLQSLWLTAPTTRAHPITRYST